MPILYDMSRQTTEKDSRNQYIRIQYNPHRWPRTSAIASFQFCAPVVGLPELIHRKPLPCMQTNSFLCNTASRLFRMVESLFLF